MSASQEKVKQNFIPISNQKTEVHVIHECALYSNKYGTSINCFVSELNSEYMLV